MIRPNEPTAMNTGDTEPEDDTPTDARAMLDELQRLIPPGEFISNIQGMLTALDKHGQPDARLRQAGGTLYLKAVEVLGKAAKGIAPRGGVRAVMPMKEIVESPAALAALIRDLLQYPAAVEAMREISRKSTLMIPH